LVANRGVAYLQGIVLDEVDVLLGDHGAFEKQVAPLVAAAGPDTRLVLVTATLPEDTFLKLQGFFPGLAAATGPNLHKIAIGVPPASLLLCRIWCG
jgi:hypothetical protein